MNDDYDDFKYEKNNNLNKESNIVYHYDQSQNEEKIPYNTIYSQNNKYSSSPKERFKYIKIILPIIFLVFFSTMLVIRIVSYKKESKDRTFMIYMVGSDLESKSKQGTFSISDIVGDNIDLENNNVVLMVGGAKKWHNFVNEKEIGIYSLTKEGFVKDKSLQLESMGTSDMLESFLEYSYKNYKADKYDMIFWNHGLGSIGIEEDELSNDFLTISELNKAFSNSPFNNNKLELTIFYNCLASNLHIANIMKYYSDYMVASEEILYLSKLLNRLNFLEEVKKEDSAYDVGLLFIEQSDKVTNEYNDSHVKKVDSTLSIIDLNNIDNLNDKLNDFVKEINVKDNYYAISKFRRNTHTYGTSQTYDYDTIDLYELVSALGDITNNKDIAKDVLSEIDDTVKYLSSLNDYSKGLSIYFPYYGSDSAIETHLSLFEKVFDDEYYSFINSFHNIRNGTKKSRRSGRSGKANILTNNIVKESNGNISIELKNDEKKNYQDGTIYIFSKNNDRYELLLESNNIKINNNKIEFSNNILLKINNNNISYIDDSKMVYGKLSDKKEELEVKFTIDNSKISEAILDSKNYISSSLVELSDYSDISFAKVSYELFEDGMLNENFKETINKEYVKVDKNTMKISVSNNNESEYYVLFEMRDIYNDSYFSNLETIN